MRTWVILLAAGLVVLYGITILRTVSAIVDGQRVFWLDDDMMISMSCARSLAHGSGPVWYPGAERVEGYSNLGWVLVMAAVHLFPLPSTWTSLPILAIAVASAVWVLILTARLISDAGARRSPGGAHDPAGADPSTDLAHWTIYGLETPFETALLLWLILRVLREAETAQPQARTFLLAGLLGIVRVDGLLFSGLVCLVALLIHRARGRVLLMGGLALALPLANVLFRMAFNGWPLPNTYYLKLTGWSLTDRLHVGLLYDKQFLLTYGVLWLAGGIGAWTSRHRAARALWLVGNLIFLYAAYAGGDSYLDARFFAPWLPVWFALAFLAPRWLGWRMPSLRYLIGLGLLLAALITFGLYPFWVEYPLNVTYLRVGLALRNATPPDTTVAVMAAGTVPYFSERPSIDLLGKNDARIAHAPAQPEILKPGHNKFNYDLSLARYQPDLVVPLGWPPPMSFRAAGGQAPVESYAWRDGIYFSSVFQQHYSQVMFLVGVLPVFARSDSVDFDLLASGSCSRTEDPELTTVGIYLICPLTRLPVR